MAEHESVFDRARDIIAYELRPQEFDPRPASRDYTPAEKAEVMQLLLDCAESALRELQRPLDTQQVTDTHAGRALWGAVTAGNACRTLARLDLAVSTPSDVRTHDGD